MTRQEPMEHLLGWLAGIRAFSQLRIEQVALSDCTLWGLEDGQLRHQTGGFFSAVGVHAKTGQAANGAGRDWVMIDQPEVGWLGFVVRQGQGGVEWLLQAKTEPGNVHETHIAPTLQATRSNYKRLHGGKPTAFLDLFKTATTVLSDGAYSEQGTRFLWKFNRNSVVALPKENALDLSGLKHWAWCPSASLRALLDRDYTVNTDARSVIATAPWALLADGKPLFAAPVLAASYRQHKTVAAKARVVRLAEKLVPRPWSKKVLWEPVPLNRLDGYSLTDHGLRDQTGQGVLACYAIHVKGREIDTWCQPFLTQSETLDVTLLMRVVKGQAQVFVRQYREVGFGRRAEYGPSLHGAHATPEKLSRMLAGSDIKELAAVQQSDEGGRFMQVKSVYRIVLLQDTPDQDAYPFGEWVSLAVLEELVARPGTTTNELRSLVSVLLSAGFDARCQSVGPAS